MTTQTDNNINIESLNNSSEEAEDNSKDDKHEQTDVGKLDISAKQNLESVDKENNKKEEKGEENETETESSKSEPNLSKSESNLSNSDSKLENAETPVDDKGSGDKSQENMQYKNGQCIYTDPASKAQYIWNIDKKEWMPYNEPVFDGKNYSYTDANGVKYIWNTSSNAWEKSDVQDVKKNFAPDLTQEKQYGFDGVNHTFTDPRDNTVYIWDKEKNAWFPKVDEDFLAQYQMNYGFVDNTTKEETKEDEKKEAIKRKPVQQEPSWFEMNDEHNTKVYVSNLPLDITEQEFVDLMQKCGLIMKDVNTNKWKVKLYTQRNSDTLKGDALCTYIKKESVELALNVLDGYDVRGKQIEVQRAKFEMKGTYNPALKPKKKRKKEKEKEKKIQQKLFDWRPDKLRGERESNERTVIIKNLFEPSLFDSKVELILEYTQDLREECSKCGIIKKLILHDKHPDGVAQVTFSDAEEADLCIKLLNNRWFGKRQITAETWDGKTKYKVVESEAETKERLQKWNKFLESEAPN